MEVEGALGIGFLPHNTLPHNTRNSIIRKQILFQSLFVHKLSNRNSF